MSQSIEQEITIYAKIGNKDGFNKAASSVKQDQYENKLTGDSGFTRVRCTESLNAEPKYTLTLKFKTEGVEGANNMVEHTFDIDKACFDDYGKAAPRHTKKTRFCFPAENTTIEITNNGEVQKFDIPHINYEVDVYQKSDGTVSEWCKIDIEVQALTDFLKSRFPNAKPGNIVASISNLPFKPTDAILSTTDDTDEKQKLGQIWEEEFLLK